jgi:hypothetical protein
MPVRATILPLPEPGRAVLRITDLDAPAEGLTLSIQRQQGPDSHLADDGWRRTEAWLLPAHVTSRRGTLDFELGPEICDRLAGIATVRLRVKEPDIGVVATTVVAWPQMLTSGAIDPSSRGEDDIVRLRRAELAAKLAPPPAPPFEPEPPPRPIPELRAVREPVPRRSGATGWLVAAMILIALCGAGYYAYINDIRGVKGLVDKEIATIFPPPEQPAETAVASAAPDSTATPAPTPIAPPPAEPPKKSVRQTVAEFLATKPGPQAMLVKGREFAQAGNLNGAFLVWRQAAEGGNPDAELQMASFYDPLNAPPKDGFTPDSVRAAEWYERSALAGNAEAQRKYGLLLIKGGPGLPADPVKARLWLQQAADQKDADAKKALDALPK